MPTIIHSLRRLLGLRSTTPPQAPTPSPEAQAHKQFDALNKVAPIQGSGSGTAQTSSSSNDPSAFICRVPVLNRKEHVAGYTFNLQENLQSRLQGKQDLLHKVYDDALLRSLTSLGIHSLLGHRLAFIGLHPVSLDNPLLYKLPTKNTVLLLKPGRQPLALGVLQPQLEALRQAGYVYGWELSAAALAQHPDLLPLASLGDYVQFHTAGLDGLEIKSLSKKLSANRLPSQTRLRLIANELSTFDEFHLCFQSHFDFFQGSFVTSRENWHPPKSEINRMLALKLLNMLRSDEELKVIAEQITNDPVMTFKLLRYLNSPVMGLAQPVVTIDKALLVLGRERCYRWLSLLLFDIKEAGFRERMLTEQALTRAFFLESLAGQGKLPAKGEELFILGLFSMLDLLIGHPLPQILEETRLPSNIHNALLGQSGLYHHALELAKACENANSEATATLAQACGLDAQLVLQASIDALGKANSITGLSEPAA